MRKPGKKTTRKARAPKLGARVPNKWAEQLERNGGGYLEYEGQPKKWVPMPKGRPRKGEHVETTRTHAVRLPDSVWEKLKQLAEARGTGANTLAAEVLAEFAQRGAA